MTYTAHADAGDLGPERPEVTTELFRMNLESARPLCDALRAGYNDAMQCTAHDVASKEGYLWWSTPLRYLGDFYKPKGFTRERPRNFEVLVSPDRSYRIAVAGGDRNVGLEGPGQMPNTKIDKGPLTGQAVGRNIYQLTFDPRVHPVFRELSAGGMQTYHLLWFFDENKNVIRSELSVPVEFTPTTGDRGLVTRYEPRLILPTILPASNTEPDDDEGDEGIDVPIKRR